MKENTLKNTIQENTQANEESLIITLANDLKNILIASKKQAIIDKTSLFLLKSIEHCKKYGDTSLFKKVFFIKVDNTTLYNKLGLKNYFEENDVCFLYNVKKDSLKIFGDYKNLKESFKEYRERKRQEAINEKLSLSKEEKLKNLFESKIKNLSQEEKDLFKTFMKTL